MNSNSLFWARKEKDPEIVRKMIRHFLDEKIDKLAKLSTGEIEKTSLKDYAGPTLTGIVVGATLGGAAGTIIGICAAGVGTVVGAPTGILIGGTIGGTLVGGAFCIEKTYKEIKNNRRKKFKNLLQSLELFNEKATPNLSKDELELLSSIKDPSKIQKIFRECFDLIIKNKVELEDFSFYQTKTFNKYFCGEKSQFLPKESCEENNQMLVSIRP
jgi:hypothetical protein